LFLAFERERLLLAQRVGGEDLEKWEVAELHVRSCLGYPEDPRASVLSVPLVSGWDVTSVEVDHMVKHSLYSQLKVLAGLDPAETPKLMVE
jgi:hypothetical protein